MAGFPPLSLTSNSSAYAGPAIGGNLTFYNGSAGIPNAGPGKLNSLPGLGQVMEANFLVPAIAALMILAYLKRK